MSDENVSVEKENTGDDDYDLDENDKEIKNEIEDDTRGDSLQVLVDPEGVALKMEDSDEEPR